jgi:glycerol 3-phosphatase-2
MVGDRLDTDMGAAVAAGVAGALVLTGVSTGVDVVTAPPALRPTFVLAGLPELLTPYAEPSVEVGSRSVRANVAQWRVDVSPLAVEWRGAGPPSLAVRALAAASWAAADAGRPVPAPVLAAGVEAVPAQR